MIISSLVVILLGAQSTEPDTAWRMVADGIEYAAMPVTPKPSVGHGTLHVVRIDPSKAHLRLLSVSKIGGALRTARKWRDEFKLTAVINAGMYQEDLSTHTGFFRIDKHVNSTQWVKGYRSVLLIGPRRPDIASATIADAANGDDDATYDYYQSVSQNLRLIRGEPPTNVWKPSDQRWSEAAVALDDGGRLLFLFSGLPLSMHDFSALLLRLPLGIVRAMHVEGGPEASLSVRGNGIELDLSGTYDTSFDENDGNRKQLPLPNVIGVD